MPHFEQRVVIARTPDEIWAFTLNRFNSPRWFRGMLGARWVSGGRPGPDATFLVRMIVLGLETRLECHVTEWQPGRALAYTIKGRPFRSAFRRVTLTPAEDGTEFRAVTEFELRPALKLIWPIAAPIFRRSWDANTSRLKELIEAEAHQAGMP
jgi:hypothetical protein